MKTQLVNITKYKNHYERNFDNRLHCMKQNPKTCSYIYFRCEYAVAEKVGLQKIASNTDGPYFMHEMRDSEAVLKIIENIKVMFLDRVELSQGL